jgi:hypothetical protein
VPVPIQNIPLANNELPQAPQAEQKSDESGRLSKEKILSCFLKHDGQRVIEPAIKTFKEIYSEESIIPEANKATNLPMERCIMPPKRSPYPPRGDYSQEGPNAQYGNFRNMKGQDYNRADLGIIPGSEFAHDSLSNAPLWYDAENERELDDDMKDGEFNFESQSMSKRQVSLEEEKKKFNAQSKPDTDSGPQIPKEENTKLEKDLKKWDEEGFSYSSVDEKFEKKLKTSEIFDNPSDKAVGAVKSESIAAIDLKTIEAQMIKDKPETKKTQEDDGSEQEAPEWDAFTADEIHKHTEQHMSDWGLTLNQSKEKLINGAEQISAMPSEPERYNVFGQGHPHEYANKAKSAPVNQEEEILPSQFEKYASIKEQHEELPPARMENRNPFCHSSLMIKETDNVWYYKDMQNCVQGPFTSIDMYMWYKAGYFPSNLLVRCDTQPDYMNLDQFILSITCRPLAEPTPVQHFDNSNMQTFFESHQYPQYGRPVRFQGPPAERDGIPSLADIEKNQFLKLNNPFGAPQGYGVETNERGIQGQWPRFYQYQVRMPVAQPAMPMFYYPVARQPNGNPAMEEERRGNINALFENPAQFK